MITTALFGVRPATALLVVAIVLTGLNLRTAVTTIGPLLQELQRALGMSAAVAGVLTTLPVLAFAAFGALTPVVARRIGEQGTLAAALAVTTVGLAGRALAGTAATFLLLSVLALVAGAVGNVALPGVVKRSFPRHTGVMVGAYTTALAVGQASAAALAVPLATWAGQQGWRLGVGVWAAVSAAAVLPWLVLLSSARQGRAADGRAGVAVRRLARSRTAWALTALFAAQSAQAYIAFGWYAQFFRDTGVPAAAAGLLVGFVSILAIPMALLVPPLAARMASQRPLVGVLAGCMLAAYLGMIVAPQVGAWLWMLFAGVGLGMFPLVLTMIALRTRDATATTTLSAFTQGIGYTAAATGPLLVGVLRGATGGWTWPFAVMLTLLGVMIVAGWFAARDRHVDDELPAAAG